jgi:nitrate reductase delta subunit
MFGPGADGVEPLLASKMTAPLTQPVHFHPRAAKAGN